MAIFEERKSFKSFWKDKDKFLPVLSVSQTVCSYLHTHTHTHEDFFSIQNKHKNHTQSKRDPPPPHRKPHLCPAPDPRGLSPQNPFYASVRQPTSMYTQPSACYTAYSCGLIACSLSCLPTSARVANRDPWMSSFQRRPKGFSLVITGFCQTSHAHPAVSHFTFQIRLAKSDTPSSLYMSYEWSYLNTDCRLHLPEVGS